MQLSSDICEAPAPNDFHVLSIGSGFVDLEWSPVWQDALHTLLVFQESNTGGWNILASYFYVPGNTFSVPGLSAGSYKVSIATVCTDTGETGIDTSELKIKIVDLTTGGRIPLNPTPVVDCNNIDYLNHEWVGFRVKEKATGISNLFEYQEEGLTALIRRVYNNPIVAVDEDGNFPIGNQRITVNFSFQINDNIKPPADKRIGFIELSTLGQTIGLCIDYENPVAWKPAYEFTALTAENILVSAPPSGGTGQGLSKSLTQNELIAQNPFTDVLNICWPESDTEEDEIFIQMLDMNGEAVLIEHYTEFLPSFMLPTGDIPHGPYFLQLKTKMGTHTLKVIKI